MELTRRVLVRSLLRMMLDIVGLVGSVRSVFDLQSWGIGSAFP